MNTLQDYYTATEIEDADIYSLENTLNELPSKSKAGDILNSLVEHGIIINCVYRNDQFVFWDSITRYKFDKLGFASIDSLVVAVQAYLVKRFDDTQNQLLKAKYAHTLWHSTMSNKFIYGKASIDNYIEVVCAFILEPTANERDYGKLINHLRDLDKLSHSINYKTVDNKALLQEVIAKSASFPNWFNFYVLEIVYEIRSEFTKEFLGSCYSQLESLFVSLTDGFLKDEVYNFALKLGAILKVTVIQWHKLIGEYYLSLTVRRSKGEPDFLIPEFYSKALNYYRQANDTEMVSKLNADYQRIKSENELPTVEIKTPISEEHSKMITEYKKGMHDLIDKLDEKTIIQFLCNSKELVPRNNNTTVEEPFLQFVSNSNYDRNNNFNHAPSKGIVNGLSLAIAMFIKDTLNYCFYHGISTGKLSAESTITFFQTDSWIGTLEHSKYWVDLLRPGLSSFFQVYKRSIAGETIGIDDLVLATDSLSTKMEGLLRAFAQLNNVNTTKVEDEKISGAKNVQTREIYMTELLTDQYPNFKELFDDDEYKFLKYIYLKDGLNIRNDIAHSFYKPENYSMAKLLLIVLSLFRISKLKVLGQH